MTTINTIEDLMRVLDENPEWLEAMRVRLLTRELIELPRVVAELSRVVTELAKSTNERFDKVESDIRTLRDDIAPIKGAHARNVAIEQADLIVEAMGLTWKRTLTHQEVADLVRSSDTSDVPRNELGSCRVADLIVECADTGGETCYAAVEVSYTVNGRDTTRAVRNAGYLERFTGRPARAVIAGDRMDERVRESVESGRVFWYRLDQKALAIAAE